MKRTPTNYSNWMASFRYIRNPVVAFFDVDTPFVRRFRRIRKDLKSVTEIRQIGRDKLWTFRILPNVSRIFRSPDYPLNYPNTFRAEYACVSSSRFELLGYVIEDNPFKTKYFAWLDIGYFRRRLDKPVTVDLPLNFRKTKIAFAEIEPRIETLTATDIIGDNVNWVAAGLFVAHHKVMAQFVSGYLANLRYFLVRGLMSAEQQMIYAMFNTNITREILPEIQLYRSTNTKKRDPCSKWFLLGCLCTRPD